VRVSVQQVTGAKTIFEEEPDIAVMGKITPGYPVVYASGGYP
jgi:glutamate-1-semialdehyde aminotransferase